MDTATAPRGDLEIGAPARDISREIVSLHKRYFGRGPVHIRTHVLDDCVLVLMEGGHAPHERTLAENGHGDRVQRMRSAIHKSLRAAYADAVEQRTGRRVVGFMCDSQSDPSLECQVYVLEPADSASTGPRVNGSAPAV